TTNSYLERISVLQIHQHLSSQIVIPIQQFKNVGNVNLVNVIIPDVHAFKGKRSVLSAGKQDTFNFSVSPRKCHLTSDPNTDVKALSVDISTLSLAVLSQNSSHVFKTLISASGQKHDFIVDTGSVESIIGQYGYVFSSSVLVTANLVKFYLPTASNQLSLYGVGHPTIHSQDPPVHSVVAR
ncbi:hypothetical protein T265_15748, partial [Opisthorchis viverrini]